MPISTSFGSHSLRLRGFKKQKEWYPALNRILLTAVHIVGKPTQIPQLVLTFTLVFWGYATIVLIRIYIGTFLGYLFFVCFTWTFGWYHMEVISRTHSFIHWASRESSTEALIQMHWFSSRSRSQCSSSDQVHEIPTRSEHRRTLSGQKSFLRSGHGENDGSHEIGTLLRWSSHTPNEQNWCSPDTTRATSSIFNSSRVPGYSQFC